VRGEGRGWGTPVPQNSAERGKKRMTTYEITEEVIKKLKPLYEERAKERQRDAGKQYGENHPQEGSQNSVNPLDTQKELAKAAGVSHDTISKVETIIEEGSPQLQEMARKKEISIHAASHVVAGRS